MVDDVSRDARCIGWLALKHSQAHVRKGFGAKSEHFFSGLTQNSIIYVPRLVTALVLEWEVFACA